MARVELALAVLDDFDRILDHLVEFEVAQPAERVSDIFDALQLLTRSPRIGRPVQGRKRELVIGQQARGCVALYRFIADIDTVFALAVRGQKERGFKRRAR